YYQFVHAVKGMGEACLKFDTPVTGGNVSFYNQSPDGPVYPTPTIGMVGLLESIDEKMTLDFRNPGDIIYLIGEPGKDINSSEYLHKIIGEEFSPAPYFDLDTEYNLQQTVLLLIKNKLIVSAHDVSEGGLVVTLFESSFYRELGFEVSMKLPGGREDAYWFGEAQSRVVISVQQNQQAGFIKNMETSGTAFSELGRVTKGDILVSGENWGFINEWKDIYDNAIGNYLRKEQSADALTPI
ncbi:MAG TPA: AIR synthase-related protein, partial [Ferruginibacter sp.]|nr:AIR synthase-related protein [Ferruginibacter sp.]